MALVPWRSQDAWLNPFSELEQIQNEMNKLFNLSIGRWPDRTSGLMEGRWSPAIDVFDSKDNILVKADIPGMAKDDINVSVHGDTLVIKGEKKQESETKEKDFVRTERYYGSFHRAVSLPAEVDANKVSATYKNGVLELTLPKKEEAKPKEITIDVK